MKTLAVALLMLVGCTTQEWKCPNAPKVVANFSVGDHVAFAHEIYVRVEEYQFDVEVGDTGIVKEIEYLDDTNQELSGGIRYHVLLDKGRDKGWEAHAFQSVSGKTIWDGWLKAIPTPKFHVGDKVALTRDLGGFLDFAGAKKGTIVSIKEISYGKSLGRDTVFYTVSVTSSIAFSAEEDWFEAVVYPDKSLAPSER